MKGASPIGAQSEQEASRWVREMFGRVAPRYDIANHLLSFQIDRYWRAQTVRSVRAVLSRPDSLVLDLCCGTGDLMIALESERQAPILGSDFCHPMLTIASHKLTSRDLHSKLFESDAMNLPLPNATMDLITIAFGFRNLASYKDALRELRRVLRPGGMLAILEFSTPPNRAFARLYDWYSLNILPRLGGAISGAQDAYSYLPESVRKFPGAEELAAWMEEAGFTGVSFRRMTGGIVALHTATV